MKSVLVALVAMCALLFGLWRCSAQGRQRAQSNVEVLLDSITTYRVRDSLSVASVAALTLTMSEMKRYRAADVELINDLKLRLSRVNSVATIGVAYRNEFKIKASDNGLWFKKDAYNTFSATLSGDTLTSNIEVKDTIIQILHRVPRFKFLGIWFGTKGVRQEVVSKNPNVQISYASYVEIKKR